MGVYTNFSGSKDFYIGDNYFIGRNDPRHMIGWAGNFWAQFAGVDGQIFPPKMASYIAVKVYGSGHVMAYNYVANFHDGIDTETYGNPDGSAAIDGPKYPPREFWERRPVSIDNYNNYMTNFHDDAFEIDGSMHNVRVMRNLMINSASQPLCNQPALGGPVYWIRNVSYNVPGGQVRFGGGSGILFYNNTLFGEVSGGTTSNTHFRNNLILAQNAIAGLGGGNTASPAVFGFTTYTNYTSSDYNGFSPNPNAPVAFQWNSPQWNVAADYASRGHNAQIENRGFQTLDEYQKASHQDAHSILIGYDSFVNVPRLDGHDVKTVQKLYDAKDIDFRLKTGSPAIDRGIPLLNVTDGFAGRAPDMGAVEFGQTPPHYGPRP
jgi:hypothetical protein